MSQRDQSGSGQRASGSGRGGSNPPSRPPVSFDDDGFELPVWGDASTSARPGSRANRAARPQNHEPSAEQPPRRATGTDRIPSLGDAFGRREGRRAASADSSDYDADIRAPVDDPYDRLRVRSVRQRQAAPIDDFGRDDWSEQADAANADGRMRT